MYKQYELGLSVSDFITYVQDGLASDPCVFAALDPMGCVYRYVGDRLVEKGLTKEMCDAVVSRLDRKRYCLAFGDAVDEFYELGLDTSDFKSYVQDGLASDPCVFAVLDPMGCVYRYVGDRLVEKGLTKEMGDAVVARLDYPWYCLAFNDAVDEFYKAIL